MATAERPKLTPAQERHLRELVKDGPYWRTNGRVGETRCAEALLRLGLVKRGDWYGAGGRPTYELTDAGRAWVAAAEEGLTHG